MVNIEEVLPENEQEQTNGGSTTNNTPQEEEETPSETRLRDADVIERLSKSIVNERPSARAHLDVLVAKLRREGAALKRVEASKARAAAEAEAKAAASTKSMEEDEDDEEEAVLIEEVSKDVTATAMDVDEPKPSTRPTKLAPTSATAAPPTSDSVRYIPIDKFAFDMGSYNSQYVTLYINLPNVGSIAKTNVTCNFTPESFDLVVLNLENKNYRLFKDNLEHDIDPDKSKYIVKSDKVVIKLAKKKTTYGYDNWNELISKKGKKTAAEKQREKDDPSSSIMDMMKDMYDKGDDNMKRMIGETMMKQRRGELDKPEDMMGGMGGMGL